MQCRLACRACGARVFYLGQLMLSDDWCAWHTNMMVLEAGPQTMPFIFSKWYYVDAGTGRQSITARIEKYVKHLKIVLRDDTAPFADALCSPRAFVVDGVSSHDLSCRGLASRHGETEWCWAFRIGAAMGSCINGRPCRHFYERVYPMMVVCRLLPILTDDESSKCGR